SQRDGRGPYAWNNDWLFVPLHDRRGRRIGYIWVDDPVDRLRPDAERLQILRAFANQATTALEQASQFEEIQDAYEHHGALIDARISAAPVRNAKGEVVSAIAVAIDVTARKRSERALAASEGRKDAVLRASLDCAVIVDHEGLITEVNPATEETFGWTR